MISRAAHRQGGGWHRRPHQRRDLSADSPLDSTSDSLSKRERRALRYLRRPAQRLFVDVDGDGVQDRLQCSQNGQQIEYHLAWNHGHKVVDRLKNQQISPDGSFPAYPNFCASERAWLASPKSATEPPFISAFDVDGDGTSNVLVNDPHGL